MSKKVSRRPSSQVEVRSTAGLPILRHHAAGADIGAHEIYVCIPGPDNTQLVRTFGVYTADLHALADWLVENHIETIAFESTGVYWIPLFELLETRGLECCLISGNNLHHIPGQPRSPAAKQAQLP